ncbi:hypothetical protein R3P38DRAFT_2815769 [Favolaschia claudopus]|uniref:RING-type domain-containing protein n=1 Tax=Favolaschia claudopus TaxID=2862362 RepID=A0AAV9Z0E8_9AGAR
MEYPTPDYDSTTTTLSVGHVYPFDFVSGALDSASPTPLRTPTSQPPLSRPIARRTWSRSANTSSLPTSKALDDHSKTESDETSKCGICFEPAIQPTLTACCSQLFCADHISAWLRAPFSLGLCPVCRSPPTPVSQRLHLDITSADRTITPFETCDSHPTQPTAPTAPPPSPFSFFSSSSYPTSPCSSSMYSTSYYSPSPTDSDAEAEPDDDAQTLRPRASRLDSDYSNSRLGVGHTISQSLSLILWVVLIVLLMWRGRWEG